MRFEHINSEKQNNNQEVVLSDFFSLGELQEMQDSFSEVANVAIRTMDTEGNALTRPSNVSNLCLNVFSNKNINGQLCENCRPAFLGGQGIVDEDFSFECVSGLKNYILPLKVCSGENNSLIFGYMVIGPIIFMRRKDKEDYRQVVEALDIKLEDFWSLVLELRVFSHKAIRSLTDMMDQLMSRMLTLAYSKMKIQKKIESILPEVSREQRILIHSQFNEFLETFLDFLMDFSNGTVGSIMMLDRSRNELVIKVSRGLSEDVTRDARVRVGEGVAGLAAEMRKSFLIDDEVADEMLLGRLKRPGLYSSMVVPMKTGEKLHGVINISSNQEFPVRFDESSIALLTKAASVAALALDQIQSV